MHDQKQADKFKKFCETRCKLSKDRYANKYMRLTSWQNSFTNNFFGTGWYEGETWRRQFTKFGIFIGKKNAKSPFMAALALYSTIETPGDLLIVASDTNQAKIIFEAAAYMVESDPVLKKAFWPRDNINQIENIRNRSRIKVLSGCPRGKSGFDANVICDEICEWQPSWAQTVWDRIKSAPAAKTNGFIGSISHANTHMGEHPGYRRYLHAKECLKDPTIDPHFLPIVYECPAELWNKEEGWRIANPAIADGILNIDFLRDKYREGLNNPRDMNQFKIFHLNIWCGQYDTFIDPMLYAELEVDIDEKELYGCNVVGYGVDVSRRHDLTALILLVEKDDLIYLLPRLLTPESTIDTKTKVDNVPYRDWVNNGFVITTAGDKIEQAEVVDIIKEDCNNFTIDRLFIDPWNADWLQDEITNQCGIEVVEAPVNSPSWLTVPTGELERMFLKKKIRIKRNPCLAWNYQNAAIRNVGGDGIALDKRKSTGRIDGAMASVLATGCYNSRRDDEFIDPNMIFRV